jgi:Raf kinase inhibitor-like YbhB/YbcL family protein
MIIEGLLRAFGRRLRGVRAGEDNRVGEDIRFAQAPRTIVLLSDAFANGGALPSGNASPPLAWSGVPPETQMLVLVVEDVDAPLLRPLTLACAYGIDPATTSLEAGALGPAHMTMGINGAGKCSYLPPSPIPGHGVHRYVFTLLAVDFVPRFDQTPTRGRLLDAIAGHVIAVGELVGTMER